MSAIPILRRDGSVRAFAVVDDGDAEPLARWPWYLNSNGYAVRSEGRVKILMHRVVMGLAPGDGRMVDHRDGDRLNNRRMNLRECLRGQVENQQNRTRLNRNNTSGYRGVSLHRASGLWTARVVTASGVRAFYARTPEAADSLARKHRAEAMPFSADAEHG